MLQDVFASTGTDRSIALYDLRMSTPLRKLIMQTRCNSVAWNPIEAFNFTAANEDSCLYTYDMRKLQSALCVHKDFVSAVMDVDYSPTGRSHTGGCTHPACGPPSPLHSFPPVAIAQAASLWRGATTGR